MRVVLSIKILAASTVIAPTMYFLLYIMTEPDIGRLAETSKVLRAADGSILELRLTETGYWRQPVNLDDIDPGLVNMLVAYEDKRYWQHKGVDIIAIGRAVIGGLKEGRVISGASTLTMQTARLIKPELGSRTIRSKLSQMLEALRLEAHWTKSQILEAYFTLAPYGGNIEGIQAASYAWFQKQPNSLTLSEAALLVALPQSPEMRRPDRFPERAHRAKAHVLRTVSQRLQIDEVTLAEVVAERLPSQKRLPKSLAPHLMDRFLGNLPESKTNLKKEWQIEVKDMVSESIRRFDAPVNAAAMVVERKTGKVRAYIGSSDYLSNERKGAINYLMATRSPGSTLKPFIYAKAIQRNLITDNEVFQDSPVQVAGYAPGNFDFTFSGQVNLKEALVRSLNIPAIKTLELLSPELFESELRTFLGSRLKNAKRSGLSLAVGGLYMTAEDLAELYLEFANPGEAGRLTFTEASVKKGSRFLFEKSSSQVIQDLLIQYDGTGRKSAFKTGTSHDRQDAWTIQLTKDHLVMAWLGTPDNEPTKLLTGRNAAHPLTEKIIEALGLKEPERFEVKSGILASAKLVEPKCSRMIQFPENGEWIRSDNLHLAIAGDREARWYLNGAQIEMRGNQIVLPKPGAHKISARISDCIQTNEIFLDLRK